jgi:signal transduction histidine kinase/CheY-like chemotaxis protein
MVVESISGLEPHGDVVSGVVGKPLIGMTFPVSGKYPDSEHAGTVVARTDDHFGKGIGPIMASQIDTLRKLLNIHKVYNISLVRDNIPLGYITIFTLNKSIIKFKHIIETFVHQVSVALHRSQLEHELITAKNRAEESDKLKTAFLANMSHEIRTPMNGILGFAEMLNDNSLSSVNRKKYLEIINSNGKMLINLIDDIIDFAKIESGQVNIIQDDFSLNNLLNQVHSTFLASRLKRNKSRVRMIIRKSFPDEKSFIRTDPIRLRQILTNLVGNAIKFTHRGHVEFGYSLKDSKTLIFFVKDTGIGIQPDKLEVIFERFMQADSSPSRRYGGSGLGLAISKGLVELIGGRMWAESTPDLGSTFYFTLPFQPVIRKPEPAEENLQPRTEYQWEGKLFLVAEDDKFSYKFLEGFLKQTHASVIRAADGREAVELCRQNENIDLILMDIQMPEMNGLTATEEIKKFNPTVPIIAQTANAISEERQRCIKAGCDDFITKPVNINELYIKIDRWLSHRST